MSKREFIALAMSILAVILWFAENMYFGWHMQAKSPLEGSADFLVIALWVVAYFVKPSRIEKKDTIYNVQSAKFEIAKSDVHFKGREDNLENNN